MSTATAFPPPALSGEELCRAVSTLRGAAEAARGLLTPDAFAAVTDATAGQLTGDLAVVAELAQAGTSVGLGRVADCGLPAELGFVTAGSWWRAQTRVAKDDAGDQVRLARRLRTHYTATGAAWVQGVITGVHAQVIATGVDGVLNRLVRRAKRDAATAGEPLDRAALAATVEEVRATLEAELLELARHWGPETLRIALEHAPLLTRFARQRGPSLAADPDGASQEQMDAENDARVKLVEVGDMAVLTAHVSKELGAKLRTVLDQFRDRLHHGGSTGPDARASGKRGRFEPDDLDPVTGDPVCRSNQHRDAAALTAWVDATLGGGLGSNPVSERPHLDVVVSLQDLANGTGAAILERLGCPVPATTTARVACDADVRVVLVDGQYRDPHTGRLVDPAVAAFLIAGTGVLDYGRAQRIVPPALRRLLGHRDRGCAFPGCHRPPQHCQAHHVIPWERYGPTNLENCVLLCSRHHHFVHEGGWTMVARDGVEFWQPGHWDFLPPRTARL